jgi:hypothetical protein
MMMQILTRHSGCGTMLVPLSSHLLQHSAVEVELPSVRMTFTRWDEVARRIRLLSIHIPVEIKSVIRILLHNQSPCILPFELNICE